MTPAQWKSLLTTWSGQLVTTDLICHLSEAERSLKNLGYPPATEAKVTSLEKRLGVSLPPSYRTFLKATDGFRVISPFIYRIRPVEEVDWFRVENQGWIEICNEPTMYDDPDRAELGDEEYFDYKNLNEHDFREKHLFNMLQISDVNDGVMLLDPVAVTPDGEWEAWFFASWIPGAQRHASFAHMMVETYRSLRKLEKLPNKPKLPEIKIPGRKIPRRSVVDVPEPTKSKASLPRRKKGQSQLEYIAQFMMEQKEEVLPAPPELIKLLYELKNHDTKMHAKNLRILRGRLKGHGMSPRRPDLVPLAAELARSLPDAEGRCVCVSLLTDITPDGPVPEWLMKALTDSHPWVQSAGLSAVYYFKGPELVGPIIQILSAARDWSLAQRAAQALSEIGDPRAIPELAAQFERTCPMEVPIPPEVVHRHLEQYYCGVALSLARFGPVAVAKLTTMLLHTDPNRRVAAIVALRAIGESKSRKAVAELKSDPDVRVRQQVEICDRIWGDLPGFEMHKAS